MARNCFFLTTKIFSRQIGDWNFPDIWEFRLFGCRINGILLFMLNISAGFWYKSVGKQRNCFRPSVDAITAESFCDDTCIRRCYMGWPRQHLHSFFLHILVQNDEYSRLAPFSDRNSKITDIRVKIISPFDVVLTPPRRC